MPPERSPVPQDAEIESRLLVYLRDEHGVDLDGIDRDTPLVRTGVLDSVALVRLAAWAERVFGIEIPDDDIDGDHLESVAMIADYVGRRLRERA